MSGLTIQLQHSKRSLEGYLLVDQRLSGHGLVEAATLTCSHCHRQLIRNPGRERPREWCSKCDRFICDGCAAARTGVDDCLTMNQILDMWQAKAFKDEQAARAAVAPSPLVVLS